METSAPRPSQPALVETVDFAVGKYQQLTRKETDWVAVSILLTEAMNLLAPTARVYSHDHDDYVAPSTSRSTFGTTGGYSPSFTSPSTDTGSFGGFGGGGFGGGGATGSL